jgi:uncharacterized protein (DUF488 family)
MRRLSGYAGPVKPRKLFTVGYEGRSPEEFVQILSKAGVRRVIDVRELPLSRRRGFSKTKLREALEASAIDYVHLRDAGNPYRELRANIVHCLRKYSGYLAKRSEVLDQIALLAGEKSTALLCVEADADCCHRSVIVRQMLARGFSMRVTHL